MKRLSVFLFVFSMTICLGLGIVGCGGDDSSPSGPALLAPQNLVAVPLSASSMEISWENTDLYVSGYRIQRAMGAGGAWQQIAELQEIAYTYTDEGLTEGTLYRYRVQSFAPSSSSDFSASASALTPPNAPTELSATRLSSTAIALAWTDNSEVEDSFELERSLRSTSGFLKVGEFETDVVSFNDTELAEGTRYFYRLRAVKGESFSPWSNVTNATTTVFTPGAPASLEAEVVTPTQVLLTWFDNSFDELGFIAEMSLSGESNWTGIDSIPANRRQHTLAGLMSLTHYYFRICAYNDSGRSAYSNVADVETPQAPPVMPSDLNVTAPDWQAAVLEWSDNSFDELGFYVQRKRNDANVWGDIATTEPDAGLYRDESVIQLQRYNYRIAAFNEVGRSAWTVAVTIRIPEGPPLAPRNVGGVALAYNRIRLYWQAGSANTTGYYIERRVEGDEFFRMISEADDEYFEDTGLEPETTYEYRIKAYRDTGVDYMESEYSEIASIETFSLTVIIDGFEDYVPGEAPDNPLFEITLGGSSWIRVTDQVAHIGQKSLQLHDPINADGELCILMLDHRNFTKGDISLWLNFPRTGAFGLIGGDTFVNHYITFQLQFNQDNTIYVRTGTSIVEVPGYTYPVAEWFMLEIQFDAELSTYSFRINGEAVAEGLSLQRTDHAPNDVMYFVGFNTAQLPDLYIDDLLIVQVVDEEQGAGLKPPADTGFNGRQTITDFGILKLEK